MRRAVVVLLTAVVVQLTVPWLKALQLYRARTVTKIKNIYQGGHIDRSQILYYSVGILPPCRADRPRALAVSKYSKYSKPFTGILPVSK